MGVFRNIAKTNNKDSRAVMRKSLNDLTLALSDKTVCHQQLIARYFQEDEGEPCLLCDNCQKPDFKEKQDLTANEKQIIDCLRHLTFVNQRIRVQDLSQTYMGSEAKNILDNKFHKCPHYGSGKNTFKSTKKLTKFIQHLIMKGFVVEVITTSTDSKHTAVYISVGDTNELLGPDFELLY